MPTHDNRLSLKREREIRRQLDHFLPPDLRGITQGLYVFPEIVGVCAVGDPRFENEQRAAGLPTAAEVEGQDILAALNLVPQVRRELDATEVRLVEAGLDRGETFETLGAACGMSRQGMRQRYQRLGGTRRWNEN